MVGKWKTLFILIIPFLLNTLISGWIATDAAYRALSQGIPLEKIGIEITRALYTYSFYWSIIQIVFGILAIKLMGGVNWLKRLYASSDIMDKPIHGVLYIIGLSIFSYGVILIFLLINAYLAGGYERFFANWHEVVIGIPLLSKIYVIAIAPFTSGIFEEIIWRGFGISNLEKYFGSVRANILQAIAFAMWHGISLRTISSFIIGYIYGYIFIKRRRLLVISTAHILSDIIGFSAAFLIFA